MAVFQGARLRTTALPATRPARGSRTAAPTAARSIPRVRPMGLLMAGIVAGTMLGLVYLTQTLGSNATDTSIRKLEQARTELAADIRNQVVQASDLTERDIIVHWAQKHDLRRLREPLVLQVP